MNKHWHIGVNTPGHLPDPDSCYVVHTAKDAYEQVLGALEILADDVPGTPGVGQAIHDLGRDEEAVVEDLTNTPNAELVVVVDNEAFWAKTCVADCADA